MILSRYLPSNARSECMQRAAIVFSVTRKQSNWRVIAVVEK